MLCHFLALVALEDTTNGDVWSSPTLHPFLKVGSQQCGSDEEGEWCRRWERASGKVLGNVLKDHRNQDAET